MFLALSRTSRALTTAENQAGHRFCRKTRLRGIKREGKWKSAAEVLQPLYQVGTDKFPKGIKFKEVWDNSVILKTAFEEAKEMLMEATELVHLNPNYPLVLFTDASDHSVGGSLQMVSPDGE